MPLTGLSLAGYVVGRWEAGRIEGGGEGLADRSDEEPLETVLADDIERLPAAADEAATDLTPERLASADGDAALLVCTTDGAR